MKQQYSPGENRRIFGVLCAIVALVMFGSMPLYRGLEAGFSESHGLGAAMVMLREGIEQNESVATFLGLDGGMALSADGDEDGDELSFDLEAAVEAYIAANTPPSASVVLPLDGELTSPYGGAQQSFRRRAADSAWTGRVREPLRHRHRRVAQPADCGCDGGDGQPCGVRSRRIRQLSGHRA